MTTTAKFHPVHNAHDGIFNTSTGRAIDLRNPTPAMIHIEDIAYGLSNICRFGGQIKYHFSVAQHSILVSQLVPPNLQKEALLHDAAEAYLGDVIKPLKIILGRRYAELEVAFMAAICQQFDLDPEKLVKVKAFDIQALELEHEAFQKGEFKNFNSTLEHHGMLGNGFAWSNISSRVTFLRHFKSLFPVHHQIKEIEWLKYDTGKP